MKEVEVSRSPYESLMRYKRWSTDGLNRVLDSSFNMLSSAEGVIVLRLLDHVLAVDVIFRHHLSGTPHGLASANSPELPDLRTLIERSAEAAEWYIGYAQQLSANLANEELAFHFSNGDPGRMTRGEMLLHVAMHGAYHRGNIGIILQKNGIEPNPDRLTDWLDGQSAGSVAEQDMCNAQAG